MTMSMPACVLSLALTLGVCAADAATLDHPAARDRTGGEDRRPAITVLVYNYASVPPDVLIGAMSTVSRLYGHAGVETRWMDLPIDATSAPFDFGAVRDSFVVQMLIRARWADQAAGVSLGRPRGARGIAYVSFERVRQVARDVGDPKLADILGYVMVHEIAHLMLPSFAHARSGLMRERWDLDDLRRMARGALRFSASEERLIRDRCESLWRDSNVLSTR